MIFNKTLVLSDLHFGRSGNSPIANKDNLDFIEWATDEAKTWGAETCFMLGDWFNNRHQIGVGSMHAALRGLEMIGESFGKSWFISGNHDHFYREKRDITSIEFAKHIPNIIVVNDPLTVDDVTFLPWLMPNEHKTLNLKSRYVFAHLEMAGFFTNTSYEMPESDHTQTTQFFSEVGDVYTGHFHKRQFRKNITYIGNAMPFDFNDDGDSDRGIMLLEYGKEPTFRKYPNQPLYQSMKLSEMLANPETILKPNMTARITVDMPLRYEETQEIRDTLMNTYNLRKIEFANGALENEQSFDPNDKIKFQTVDQMVIAGLQNVESVELSSSRLINIYNNACRG